MKVLTFTMTAKTMRNLNRIRFINSANIPYADDIYLDGNVHFIGTQGVGKSTVLRSILFFYNADTQKLGIPVEKQSYTEYYFPYANSYIIYEVATENGAFCILSFKSMNRVSYRFIDSPYRKEFFIDPETRTAYTGADRIRMQLDLQNVDYSRIIYTFDEYRNILYGNGVSSDMKKYSLMESKQYQNIPRTIQNVLLNSKLDAEFIKKTIISSINEDETAFLAMHVGAEIERQADNKTKIPVVLLCPNYHDIVQQTMNTLMMNFGNQINLLGCIHNENDIHKFTNPIAILLTAVPIHQALPNISIVHFSPINLQSQFEIIQNAILKSQEEYRDNKLKINFHNFFEEDLFVANPNLNSKQQIITYLCDKLLCKNYVDSDFEENVYRRENAATTAFGNIAIPHAAEMNAIKTSVAVAISKNGFQWGNNTVHVVFLLAINKADRRTFRNLYESLISLFSDNRILQEMRNCNSFKEFESYIYTWIGEKES